MEIKNKFERNTLNALADDLIQEVLGNRNPFDTLTIVVPNVLVEQWFKSYWLRKCDKVLLNVKFARMVPFLNEAFNPDGLPLFMKDKMTFAILNELKNNADSYPEIKDYYQDSSTNLYDLASNLSRIFGDYEKKCYTPDGWQGKLLTAIKGTANKTLSDVLKNNPSFKGKAYIFGFASLEPVYINALNQLDNCKVYIQTSEQLSEDSCTVCEAASTEREVEYVHDEICRILKENPSAKNYDFLVYTPNVADYEVAVKKVFGTGGDKNFPEIPYVVVNTKKEASNAGIILTLLYDILATDQMNRNDLYRLLSNPNVQKARGINPSKINDIITALDQMNVYRNHEKCDEWIYGIRRLLSAKLIGNSSVDNAISIAGETCIPYGSISMDDDTIAILASLIDDIEEFRRVYDHGNISLDDLRLQLDKFLSYSKCDDGETNFYYNAALNVLDSMNESGTKPSIDIVFTAMIDAAKNITVFPSNCITGGVTFLNYSQVNVLSSKYMFFMGMGSNNLPRKDVRDELLCSSFTPDSKLESDRSVFAYLCHNAEKRFYSYVNINLKTLEEYAPSTLLPKNTSHIHYNLSVNEAYSTLYSKTEFRKKEYSNGLTGVSAPAVSSSVTLPPLALPEAVKYKNLSDLIDEGLMAKMTRFFSEYDDSIENANKAFEPLEPDFIVAAMIKKTILLTMLNKESSDLDPGEVNEIFNYYKNTHVLPYLIATIDPYVQEVKEFYDFLHAPFELKPAFDVPVELLKNGSSMEWTLSVTDKYILSEDSTDLWFYDVKPKILKETSSTSSFSKCYILSLAYLCKYCAEHQEREYLVHLNGVKIYRVTPEEASAILNRLYVEYNDYSHLVLGPVDSVDSEDFDTYIRVKGEHNAWGYFGDADMVDVRENAGFDRDTFTDARDGLKDFINKNVLYYGYEEEDNGESSNE